MRGDNAENLLWYMHGTKMNIGLFLMLRRLVSDFVHLLIDGPEHWNKDPGRKNANS
jgi:hypothetical protein